MNRKRKTSESFKQYRTNLKAEAAALTQRIAGTFAHVSTANRAVKGEGITYRR